MVTRKYIQWKNDGYVKKKQYKMMFSKKQIAITWVVVAVVMLGLWEICSKDTPPPPQQQSASSSLSKADIRALLKARREANRELIREVTGQ